MNHTIEETKGITLERIIKTYERYKTARRTARVIGISHPTVVKYLKEANCIINPVGGHILKDILKGKEYKKHSAFAKWLRNNPDVKLPRDHKKIAEITGLSFFVVDRFMKRRYNRALYYINKLGDLRKYNIKLEAEKADSEETYWWPLCDLTTINVTIDKFELKVYIDGTVEAREGVFAVKYLPIGVKHLHNLCVGKAQENDIQD
jgi:hypothetical protein